MIFNQVNDKALVFGNKIRKSKFKNQKNQERINEGTLLMNEFYTIDWQNFEGLLPPFAWNDSKTSLLPDYFTPPSLFGLPPLLYNFFYFPLPCQLTRKHITNTITNTKSSHLRLKITLPRSSSAPS